MQRLNCKAKRIIGRPWKLGQSGNPSGRRKGSVSPTAASRRALSREDTDRIARRVITLAKSGDAAALRVLLDRLDGPLIGPLIGPLAAIAMSQVNAQAVNDIGPQGAPAQIIFMDNGREKKPFDVEGYRAEQRRLMGMPNTTGDPPTPPPPQPSEPEPETQEVEPLPRGVMSGAEFLADR